MYPASLSRLVEGQNDSMEPGTRVSTVQRTPVGATHDLNARRLGVRDWVADRCMNPPLSPPVNDMGSLRPNPASPINRGGGLFANYGHTPAPPVPSAAPQRTANEQVNWVNHHGQTGHTPAPPVPRGPPPRTADERVSWASRIGRTSIPILQHRDVPPHQPQPPAQRTVASAPGGHPDTSASSPSTAQAPQPARTPRESRRREVSTPPPRIGSQVPEYPRPHRSPTFPHVKLTSTTVPVFSVGAPANALSAPTDNAPRTHSSEGNSTPLSSADTDMVGHEVVTANA
jgi:hypothetical protein